MARAPLAERCPTCRSEYPDRRNTVYTDLGDRYRYKPCRDAWHDTDRPSDAELAAMRAISKVLDPMPAPVQRRSARWLRRRHADSQPEEGTPT